MDNGKVPVDPPPPGNPPVGEPYASPEVDASGAGESLPPDRPNPKSEGDLNGR